MYQKLILLCVCVFSAEGVKVPVKGNEESLRVLVQDPTIGVQELKLFRDLNPSLIVKKQDELVANSMKNIEEKSGVHDEQKERIMKEYLNQLRKIGETGYSDVRNRNVDLYKAKTEEPEVEDSGKSESKKISRSEKIFDEFYEEPLPEFSAHVKKTKKDQEETEEEQAVKRHNSYDDFPVFKPAIKKKQKRVKQDQEIENPKSYHEDPGEVPTRVNYPGQGQWARKGVKHKPHETIHKHLYPENVNKNGEYEIYDYNRNVFDDERDAYFNDLKKYTDHNVDSTNHEVEPEVFIPYRNYAQVRRSDVETRIPKKNKKKDKRLKEVQKNTKAHTVYTEEGYEDSAYDHGGTQKKADKLEKDKRVREEGEAIKEEETRPLPPEPPRYEDNQEDESEFEEILKQDSFEPEKEESESNIHERRAGRDDVRRRNGAETRNQRYKEIQSRRNVGNKPPTQHSRYEEPKKSRERKHQKSKYAQQQKTQETRHEPVISRDGEPSKYFTFENEDWFQQYRFKNIGDFFTLPPDEVETKPPIEQFKPDKKEEIEIKNKDEGKGTVKKHDKEEQSKKTSKDIQKDVSKVAESIKTEEMVKKIEDKSGEKIKINNFPVDRSENVLKQPPIINIEQKKILSKGDKTKHREEKPKIIEDAQILRRKHPERVTKKPQLVQSAPRNIVQEKLVGEERLRKIQERRRNQINQSAQPSGIINNITKRLVNEPSAETAEASERSNQYILKDQSLEKNYLDNLKSAKPVIIHYYEESPVIVQYDNEENLNKPQHKNVEKNNPKIEQTNENLKKVYEEQQINYIREPKVKPVLKNIEKNYPLLQNRENQGEIVQERFYPTTIENIQKTPTPQYGSEKKPNYPISRSYPVIYHYEENEDNYPKIDQHEDVKKFREKVTKLKLEDQEGRKASSPVEIEEKKLKNKNENVTAQLKIEDRYEKSSEAPKREESKEGKITYPILIRNIEDSYLKNMYKNEKQTTNRVIEPTINQEGKYFPLIVQKMEQSYPKIQVHKIDENVRKHHDGKYPKYEIKQENEDSLDKESYPKYDTNGHTENFDERQTLPPVNEHVGNFKNNGIKIVGEQKYRPVIIINQEGTRSDTEPEIKEVSTIAFQDEPKRNIDGQRTFLERRNHEQDVENDEKPGENPLVLENVQIRYPDANYKNEENLEKPEKSTNKKYELKHDETISPFNEEAQNRGESQSDDRLRRNPEIRKHQNIDAQNIKKQEFRQRQIEDNPKQVHQKKFFPVIVENEKEIPAKHQQGKSEKFETKKKEEANPEKRYPQKIADNYEIHADDEKSKPVLISFFPTFIDVSSKNREAEEITNNKDFTEREMKPVIIHYYEETPVTIQYDNEENLNKPQLKNVEKNNPKIEQTNENLKKVYEEQQINYIREPKVKPVLKNIEKNYPLLQNRENLGKIDQERFYPTTIENIQKTSTPQYGSDKNPNYPIRKSYPVMYDYEEKDNYPRDQDQHEDVKKFRETVTTLKLEDQEGRKESSPVEIEEKKLKNKNENVTAELKIEDRYEKSNEAPKREESKEGKITSPILIRNIEDSYLKNMYKNEKRTTNRVIEPTINQEGKYFPLIVQKMEQSYPKIQVHKIDENVRKHHDGKYPKYEIKQENGDSLDKESYAKYDTNGNTENFDERQTLPPVNEHVGNFKNNGIKIVGEQKYRPVIIINQEGTRSDTEPEIKEVSTIAFQDEPKRNIDGQRTFLERRNHEQDVENDEKSGEIPLVLENVQIRYPDANYKNEKSLEKSERTTNKKYELKDDETISPLNEEAQNRGEFQSDDRLRRNPKIRENQNMDTQNVKRQEFRQRKIEDNPKEVHQKKFFPVIVEHEKEIPTKYQQSKSEQFEIKKKVETEPDKRYPQKNADNYEIHAEDEKSKPVLISFSPTFIDVSSKNREAEEITNNKDFTEREYRSKIVDSYQIHKNKNAELLNNPEESANVFQNQNIKHQVFPLLFGDLKDFKQFQIETKKFGIKAPGENEDNLKRGEKQVNGEKIEPKGFEKQTFRPGTVESRVNNQKISFEPKENAREFEKVNVNVANNPVINENAKEINSEILDLDRRRIENQRSNRESEEDQNLHNTRKNTSKVPVGDDKYLKKDDEENNQGTASQEKPQLPITKAYEPKIQYKNKIENNKRYGEENVEPLLSNDEYQRNGEVKKERIDKEINPEPFLPTTKRYEPEIQQRNVGTIKNEKSETFLTTEESYPKVPALQVSPEPVLPVIKGYEVEIPHPSQVRQIKYSFIIEERYPKIQQVNNGRKDVFIPKIQHEKEKKIKTEDRESIKEIRYQKIQQLPNEETISTLLPITERYEPDIQIYPKIQAPNVYLPTTKQYESDIQYGNEKPRNKNEQLQKEETAIQQPLQNTEQIIPYQTITEENYPIPRRNKEGNFQKPSERNNENVGNDAVTSYPEVRKFNEANNENINKDTPRKLYVLRIENNKDNYNTKSQSNRNDDKLKTPSKSRGSKIFKGNEELRVKEEAEQNYPALFLEDREKWKQSYDNHQNFKGKNVVGQGTSQSSETARNEGKDEYKLKQEKSSSENMNVKNMNGQKFYPLLIENEEKKGRREPTVETNEPKVSYNIKGTSKKNYEVKTYPAIIEDLRKESSTPLMIIPIDQINRNNRINHYKNTEENNSKIQYKIQEIPKEINEELTRRNNDVQIVERKISPENVQYELFPIIPNRKDGNLRRNKEEINNMNGETTNKNIVSRNGELVQESYPKIRYKNVEEHQEKRIKYEGKNRDDQSRNPEIRIVQGNEENNLKFRDGERHEDAEGRNNEEIRNTLKNENKNSVNDRDEIKHDDSQTSLENPRENTKHNLNESLKEKSSADDSMEASIASWKGDSQENTGEYQLEESKEDSSESKILLPDSKEESSRVVNKLRRSNKKKGKKFRNRKKEIRKYSGNIKEINEDDIIDTVITAEEFGKKIRSRRSVNEEEKGGKTDKYPNYNSENLDKTSGFRYAENPGNVVVKHKNQMVLYDRAEQEECPDTEDINPVPENVTKPKNETANSNSTEYDPKTRIKGKLSNQIDCLKRRYFGDNPLDNPLFEEEYDGTVSSSVLGVERTGRANEGNSQLPKAEPYVIRRRVVRRRPQQHFQQRRPERYENVEQQNDPQRHFSEVHYKEEIKPSEQLNVFADIINNIKTSNEDSESSESKNEQIYIRKQPNNRHYKVRVTTSKPFLPTPLPTENYKRLPIKLLAEHKDADEIIIVKKPPKNHQPKREEEPRKENTFNEEKYVKATENLPMNKYYYIGLRPPPKQPYKHPNFYNREVDNSKNSSTKRRRIKRSRGYAEIRRNKNETGEEIDDYVPHRQRNFHYDEKTGKIVYDKKPEEIREEVEYEYVEIEEPTHPPPKMKEQPKRFPPTPPPGPSYLDYVKILKSNPNYTVIEDPKPVEKDEMDENAVSSSESSTVSNPSPGIPEFLSILKKVKSDKSYVVYLDPTPETKTKSKKKNEERDKEEGKVEAEVEEVEADEEEKIQNSPGLQGIINLHSPLPVFDIFDFVPKTKDYSPKTSIDTSKYVNIRRNSVKNKESKQETAEDVREEPETSKILQAQVEEIITTTPQSQTIEIPTTSAKPTTPIEEASEARKHEVQTRRTLKRRPTISQEATTTSTTLRYTQRKQRGRARYRSTTPSSPIEENVRNRRNLRKKNYEIPRNHRRNYARTRNDIETFKPTPRSITLNVINQTDIAKLVNGSKIKEGNPEKVEVFEDFDKGKKHGGNYKYKKVQIKITRNFKPGEGNGEKGENGKNEEGVDASEFYSDPKLAERINRLKEKDNFELTETFFQEENTRDGDEDFEEETTRKIDVTTKKVPNIIKDPSKRLYFYAPI